MRICARDVSAEYLHGCCKHRTLTYFFLAKEEYRSSHMYYFKQCARVTLSLSAFVKYFETLMSCTRPSGVFVCLQGTLRRGYCGRFKRNACKACSFCCTQILNFKGIIKNSFLFLSTVLQCDPTYYVFFFIFLLNANLMIRQKI
jgi:hypothetical protein